MRSYSVYFRGLLLLSAVLLLLVARAAPAASTADFALRVNAQTATTITLGWDRVTGATGFQFLANGSQVSSTNDGTRTSVRFAAGATSYEVRALPAGTGSGYWPAAPPPPPPSTLCRVSNAAAWNWRDCTPGTTIVSSNGWSCSKPLSSYGPLPLLVRVTGGGNGVTLDAGCVGSGHENVALIVDISGVSIDAFKTRVSPRDIVVTGRMNCGPRAPDAHQDTMQFQGGSGITIVNAESGNWTAGTATCQNAGGAAFYSTRSPQINIVGSFFVGCNHGLLGNVGSGVVRDSGFRTGAPNTACRGIAVSAPCIVNNSAIVIGPNVVCQRYRNGTWTNG